MMLTEEGVRERIERFPVEGTPAQMRRSFGQLADLPVKRGGVRCTTRALAGMQVLEVEPEPGAASQSPTIVHLHGGGYVFGSPETHERMAIVLALACRARVLVPAYPLGPEHPWPAQLSAVVELARLLDTDNSLVLSGDSAGGHLAILSALRLPRKSIQALLLFSPNTLRDYAMTQSRQALAAADAMNDPDTDDRLAGMAFGEVSASDADQNPALADLSGLPATYIDVGDSEVLLDDSLILARQARQAGVRVTCQVEPNAFHLRQLFAQHWPVADRSLERAAEWLRTVPMPSPHA